MYITKTTSAVAFRCCLAAPPLVTRPGFGLLHTGAAALTVLILAAHPVLGWFYLIPVGVATMGLMIRNVRLLAQPEAKQAFSLFKASNLYLAIVLLMICVDVLV